MLNLMMRSQGKDQRKTMFMTTLVILGRIKIQKFFDKPYMTRDM